MSGKHKCHVLCIKRRLKNPLCICLYTHSAPFYLQNTCDWARYITVPQLLLDFSGPWELLLRALWALSFFPPLISAMCKCSRGRNDFDMKQTQLALKTEQTCVSNFSHQRRMKRRANLRETSQAGKSPCRDFSHSWYSSFLLPCVVSVGKWLSPLEDNNSVRSAFSFVWNGKSNSLCWLDWVCPLSKKAAEGLCGRAQ